MTREELLHELAAIIASRISSRCLRVAIDGIDAAGKTTLADELAVLMQAQGLPVIRASIDGFHQPRSERYRRGPDSPEGYYEDSFDYDSLKTMLLRPLGLEGNGRYRRAAFDFREDAPLSVEEEEALPNAILLFDGVFLQRPELADSWDYRIFVDVKKETALQRALERDLSLLGSTEVIQTRYEQRYFPGQQMYDQAVHPQEQADVIIDNNDPSHPQLIFPQPSLASALAGKWSDLDWETALEELARIRHESKSSPPLSLGFEEDNNDAEI